MRWNASTCGSRHCPIPSHPILAWNLTPVTFAFPPLSSLDRDLPSECIIQATYSGRESYLELQSYKLTHFLPSPHLNNHHHHHHHHSISFLKSILSQTLDPSDNSYLYRESTKHRGVHPFSSVAPSKKSRKTFWKKIIFVGSNFFCHVERDSPLTRGLSRRSNGSFHWLDYRG